MQAQHESRSTPSSSAPASPAAGRPRSSPNAGCACCCSSAARTSSTSRTTPNARKAPWEYPHRGGRTRELVDAYPVLKRDYPLNEKNLDWWVERAGVAVHRGEALRLVPRLPRGRPLAHVGPPELSPQRPRLRGQRQGGHRRRLADPLRRHRAVVRPRRAARRHQRVGRRAAAAARRPVPAGDAAQLRRGARSPAGCAKQFEGTRRIIPGRVANLTQPLGRRGRCQYRNACWLGCPYGAYFSTQSSTLPAAVATGRLTLKPFTPSSPTCSTTRTASARPACACSTPHTKRDDGLLGEGRLPLRLDAQLHVAPDALGHRRLARRAWAAARASSATT